MDDFNFLSSLLKVRDCSKDIREYVKNKSKRELLTEQDLAEFCSIVLLSSDDKSKRAIILQFLEDLFRKKGLPSVKLHFFGSTINGIGFYNSDIDIYIQWMKDASSEEPVTVDNPLAKLKKVKLALHGTPLMSLYRPMVISAKCPIVKLSNSHPYTMRRPGMQMVDFDINLSHPIGVFNSMVLNFIVNVEPRFKQLFTILKFTFKLNDLIELTAFRSYTLSFLIVFFLQNCEHSYIQPLDLLYEYSQSFQTKLQPAFENELYEKCINLVQNTDKLPSTFALIHQFFTFWANFDFINFVISPRFGYAIRKDHYHELMTEFDEVASIDFHLNSYICIEDPFEYDRNISRNTQLVKFSDFVRLCSWYANKPVDYFQAGSNFAAFISIPRNKNVNKPNTLSDVSRNICPCFCYSRRYFQELAKRKIDSFENKSEIEQMHQYISEFAKLVLQTTVCQLHAALTKDKFKGKFEVIQYNLVSDCFQRHAKEEENEMLDNVIGNSTTNNNLHPNWFNLADLQLKLLTMTGFNSTSHSNMPKKKKRKTTHIVDGSDESTLVDSTENGETISPTNNNCPVVNAVLQCRFFGAKSYFILFQFDSFVPKWLHKLMTVCANKVCTCQNQPNDS